MSEQERNLNPSQNELTPNQSGLTHQPNSHKLETEGNIFMAENTGEFGPHQNPQESESQRSGGVGVARDILTTEPERHLVDIKSITSVSAMTALQELQSRGIDTDIAAKFVDDDGQEKNMSSLIDMLRQASLASKENEENAAKAIAESKGKVNQYVSQVEFSSSMSDVREGVSGFLEEAGKITKLMSDTEKDEMVFGDIKGYDNLIAALNSTTTDIENLKGIVKYLSPKIKSHYESKEEGKLPDMPLCLEDLVALIMQRSEDEYKPGGEFALVEDVMVEGKREQRVNLAHFYEWVRHQMWRVHDNNPTGEANFFTDEGMGVKTSFRTINFYEIVFTPSFFHEKRRANVITGKKDANGNDLPSNIEQISENPEYEALRQKLYKETFLFMLMRNGDWMYRDNRSGEKGMMQSLEAIYKNNPITRGDFMEFILTLPSMSRTVLGEEAESGRKIKEKSENNFVMGDAIRRAWGSYIHIWDPEMVKKYLGEDTVFYKKKYAEYENGKLTGKMKHAEFNKKEYDAMFDANGNIKAEILNDPKKLAKTMEYWNIFLGPTPNQSQFAEIRERMVLSLMEREKISYSEAKLAEAWAYSLCNFTGVGARNDVKSVGFEQWTKQTNLMEYRLRQRAKSRRAKYGSKYTIDGLKRINLNFLEATRDVNGRAIYEIVQGGQGSDVDLINNPIKDYKDFERDEKGAIILRNAQGQRVTPRHNAYTYKINSDGSYHFFDENGREIIESGLTANEVKRVAKEKLEFDNDMQRQFVVNHMQMGSEWLDFIINSKEMDFKGMFQGYNSTTGETIIDQEKLIKVKEGIRKNITYTLSTWPGTDYTKKIRTWEIEKGVLKGKDMSILESMFGSEVLHFIDREMKSPRRLEEDEGGLDLGKLGVTATGLAGLYERPDIKERIENGSLKKSDLEKAIKLSIWEGAFTYMVAKEIYAHRAWDSNVSRYGLEDITAIYNVLRDGEVLYKDEVNLVKRNTDTRTRKLFLQSFLGGAASGGLRGLFKALRIAVNDVVSGKP